MNRGDGFNSPQIKGLNVSPQNSSPPLRMQTTVPYRDLSDLLGDYALLYRE